MKNEDITTGVRASVSQGSTFDAEVESIAALSIEEVRALLCQMNVVPTQTLPDRLHKLLANKGSKKSHVPPPLGERLLMLILTKEERLNIPGDLEEEYVTVATKHGERYAKLWYYKQVAASAWPMIRKGLRGGVIVSVGKWIRRSL